MLIAVIDIGSNSVRLVFYNYDKGYPQAIFNEKVTCSLGQGLQDNNNLLGKAEKQKAKQTIIRFSELIKARQPEIIEVLATAAIRDADDGHEFATELENILQNPIKILSGEQESIYAAYGVIATSWQSQGIVIDMGGGSTDISYINEKYEVQPITSIPHGALYFAWYQQEYGNKKLIQYLTKLLQPAKFYKTTNIYLVGGSFRAVAAYHMATINYPLSIIHDYELTIERLNQLSQKAEANIAEAISFKNVPKRRQNAILPAILCIQHLAIITDAKNYIFSSAGIREGALAINMDLCSGNSDPLIATMRSINSQSFENRYIEKLSNLLLSILPEMQNEKRLLQAFCYISEIAANMHPDYRAEFAFERIIAIQGYGLTHIQQVMLATCVYFRYRNKLKLKHNALKIINEDQKDLAYVIGRVANIAYGLSAGNGEMLEKFNFQVNQKRQRFEISSSNKDLLPEASDEMPIRLHELVCYFSAKQQSL